MADLFVEGDVLLEMGHGFLEASEILEYAAYVYKLYSLYPPFSVLTVDVERLRGVSLS